MSDDWVQKQMDRIHGDKEEPTEQKGGPGSGHHGHAGRPGKRGGSSPGKGGGASASGGGDEGPSSAGGGRAKGNKVPSWKEAKEAGVEFNGKPVDAYYWSKFRDRMATSMLDLDASAVRQIKGRSEGIGIGDVFIPRQGLFKGIPMRCAGWSFAAGTRTTPMSFGKFVPAGAPEPGSKIKQTIGTLFYSKHDKHAPRGMFGDSPVSSSSGYRAYIPVEDM